MSTGSGTATVTDSYCSFSTDSSKPEGCARLPGKVVHPFALEQEFLRNFIAFPFHQSSIANYLVSEGSEQSPPPRSTR